MRIDEQDHGEVTVIRPQGPLIGGEAEDLGSCLEGLFGRGRRQVVLDATKVAYVDSPALEVLVEATEQLIRTGGPMKLAAANATLREVLELTELAPLFEQFADVDEAMRSVR